MKIFRIVLGFILTIALLAGEFSGQLVNIVDEGVRVKNVNALFEKRNIKELLAESKNLSPVYDILLQQLTSVEGIETAEAEELINSEAFVNVYKDVAVKMIKYFRKDSESAQTKDELAALMSNVVTQMDTAEVKLSAEQKEELTVAIVDSVYPHLEKMYQDIDRIRNFQIFGLKDFSVFANLRILSLLVCAAILIVLCLVCWSVGKGFVIAGLASVLAAVPFLLVGLGKEQSIPFKGNGAVELLRSLFDKMSLPILIYSLIGIALGIIAVIIGISAWLGERERRADSSEE